MSAHRTISEMIVVIALPIATCTEADRNAITQKELAARTSECSNEELETLIRSKHVTLIKLREACREEALLRCLRSLR